MSDEFFSSEDLVWEYYCLEEMQKIREEEIMEAATC